MSLHERIRTEENSDEIAWMVRALFRCYEANCDEDNVTYGAFGILCTTLAEQNRKLNELTEGSS